MSRFLIYLFPAMMDMVIGTVIFVCTVRMAESGARPVAVTAVMTVTSLVYMISAQVVGSFVNSRNAATIIMAASFSMALISMGLILLPGLKVMFVLASLQAIATGFFFAPFQVFMKAVEEGKSRGIIKSTALYTFSWSAGMACGPFVSGYLWTAFGWQWCYAVNAVLAVVTCAGVYMLKHHASSGHVASVPGSETEGESAVIRRYSAMPDLAWLGWFAGGIGCVTWSVLRGFFPSTAAFFEISKPVQGNVLALALGSQAVTGLLLVRGKTWMYRAGPLACFGVFGICSMCVFGLAGSPLIFYVGAVLYGVYSGSFFFYFVFHAISHPSRSGRYVAINETIVGIAGMGGPFMAGVLAERVSMGSPYFVCASMVVIALTVQAFAHRRHAAATRDLSDALAAQYR